MTHAPNQDRPTAPVTKEDQISSAVRTLARLIARQAAGEFLHGHGDGEKGSDQDAQDEQAG